MRPISRKTFETAPQPYGPYEHAVVAGDFIFLSGQNGRSPATLKLVEGGISAQTDRAIENIRAVLKELGCDLEAVVRTTVYLNSMEDFAAMNSVYEQKFRGNLPARSTFQVTLPHGALVALDAVAYQPKS